MTQREGGQPPQGNTFSAQQYLDSAGASYLRGIGGVNRESLSRRMAETSRLKKFLPTPQTILSIGVGQGEELHALHALYDGNVRKIIGVDLSATALITARNRVAEYKLPVEFLQANATSLPLRNETVDGVLLSSILHEIYSYSADGKKAWNAAIQESTRVLAENGCMFIRDSAAPELEGAIKIKLRTNLSREFYDYFASGYRTFEGWEDAGEGLTSGASDFPSRETDTVRLSIGQAAELLFHLVNFQMGHNEDRMLNKNPRWKELNETYYIPGESGEPMRIEEYASEILHQGNKVLEGTPYELICVNQALSIRPRMIDLICQHFLLTLPDKSMTTDESEELVKYFINKMELVFRKIRKAN